MKNMQVAGIDNVFFLEKSCRKMYTIFSAVQHQQRKSDVITYFGLTACSAVYYHAGSSLFLSLRILPVASNPGLMAHYSLTTRQLEIRRCLSDWSNRRSHDFCWVGTSAVVEHPTGTLQTGTARKTWIVSLAEFLLLAASTSVKRS
jgi:hypothetical protein